jgi:DNA-binding transcriptional LysR family regulator
VNSLTFKPIKKFKVLFMVEEINLEWLKTFRTYVESETLEEVARKLEITQPAVSQHLAKLQKHFDTPLYFKKGKKKLATKQGLKLYHRISEVLLEIENSLRSFQLESKKSKNTEIRFGLSKELFCSISKHLKYEGSLNVITAASADLFPMLKQNTVDAIMCEQSKLPKLSASLKNTFSIQNCLAHNFKLIASNDLKLANQLDLSELKSLWKNKDLSLIVVTKILMTSFLRPKTKRKST